MNSGGKTKEKDEKKLVGVGVVVLALIMLFVIWKIL
jgi:hypothetical protein